MSEQYPSDLKDGQWQVFAGPVAPAGETRPAAHLPAVDSQCDLVRQSNRLSVASLSATASQSPFAALKFPVGVTM